MKGASIFGQRVGRCRKNSRDNVIHLVPFNIRVNAIAPGTIATASAAYLGGIKTNHRRQHRNHQIPLAAFFLQEAKGNPCLNAKIAKTLFGTGFSAVAADTACGQSKQIRKATNINFQN